MIKSPKFTNLKPMNEAINYLGEAKDFEWDLEIISWFNLFKLLFCVLQLLFCVLQLLFCVLQLLFCVLQPLSSITELLFNFSKLNIWLLCSWIQLLDSTAPNPELILHLLQPENQGYIIYTGGRGGG